MLESSRKHSANLAGCNFATQFTLTSHQGKLHLSDCNITEKIELRKKRRNINLPLLFFSESNNRKSQLKGLEALSCYSSLETSHIRHGNTLNRGGGLLCAHARGYGPVLMGRSLQGGTSLPWLWLPSAFALLCHGMPRAGGLTLCPVRSGKSPRCHCQGLGHRCVLEHKYCSRAAWEPAVFPLCRSRLSLSEVTECRCQLGRSSTNQSLTA